MCMCSAGASECEQAPPAERPSTTSGRRSTRLRGSRPTSGRRRRRRGEAGAGTGCVASRPCRRARQRGRQDRQRAEHGDATTSIVAIAKPMNVLSPVSSMPAIATITVRPEMSTERPEVAAAASSAARRASAGARALPARASGRRASSRRRRPVRSAESPRCPTVERNRAGSAARAAPSSRTRPSRPSSMRHSLPRRPSRARAARSAIVSGNAIIARPVSIRRLMTASSSAFSVVTPDLTDVELGMRFLDAADGSA